jgi:hypothetical protein
MVRVSRDWNVFRIRWPDVANVLQWLLVAFYTACISSTLSVFNCEKQPNGIQTLIKDASVVCFQSAWMKELPIIVLALLLYLVVVPIAVIWLFYKHRRDHRSLEFSQVYGLLISPYSDQCYFWECMGIFKRVAFVISAEFLPSRNYEVSILILMVFLWLEAIYNPYNTTEFNMLNLM